MTWDTGPPPTGPGPGVPAQPVRDQWPGLADGEFDGVEFQLIGARPGDVEPVPYPGRQSADGHDPHRNEGEPAHQRDPQQRVDGSQGDGEGEALGPGHHLEGELDGFGSLEHPVTRLVPLPLERRPVGGDAATADSVAPVPLHSFGVELLALGRDNW